MEPGRPHIDDVVRRLHAETDGFGEAWSAVRFVRRDVAERGNRTMVDPAWTVEWSGVPDAPGYLLVPYGVHQHTLVVGWTVTEAGLEIDGSRFRKRTW